MEQATKLQELKNQSIKAAQLPQVNAGFFNLQSFELMQRIAKGFASSELVPKQYQGNIANCMIALDMAERIGASPLMIMQSLYIVHGTPSWASKFLIATVNACGRFTALRYEWKGKPGELDYGCRAWAIEKSTGERLDGIWVTWQMVKAEGWDSKNGSKWKTMPDQMFVYRSASFWQRAYAPELAMGLSAAEEIEDVYDAVQDQSGAYSVSVDDLRKPAVNAPAVDTETGEIIDDGEKKEPVQQAEENPPVETKQPAPSRKPATLDLG